MVFDVEPMSTEATELVSAIRDIDAPFPVQVGGATAELVDAKSSLFGLLPIALLLIAAVTFVVLFLMFGSVLVPLKALVLNLLSLTATFGVYGLIKKQIGPAVDAVSGLTLESLWLIPIAVVQLIVVATTPAGITMGAHGGWHVVLLLFAGVATAVPLLLFAASTRRVNLTVIGMIQFITPVMQFLIGVFFLGEPMPAERWIGFILVWIAIVVFVIDLLMAARRGRRTVQAELV